MMRFNRSRRSRRNAHVMTDISMTSMIDTAWTLLVIFIIAAPVMQHGIKIQLPQGSVKEHTQKSQDVILTVAKDGGLFLNGAGIALHNLDNEFQKLPGKHSGVVIVRADQAASCGPVLQVIDRLKRINGIQHVVFATQSTTTSQTTSAAV